MSDEQKKELEILRFNLLKTLYKFVEETIEDKMTSNARVEVLPEVIKVLLSTKWC